MERSNLKDSLFHFRLHRKLTMDLLGSLKPDQLSMKPLKIAGSFGKQFRHILDIEKCYVESLIHGSLTFLRTDIDHSLETDKEGLIEQLASTDSKLEEFFERISSERAREKYIECREAVKYLGNENSNLSPIQIITMITDHEILHEGELVLYIRTLGFKFPRSWFLWGLR